MRRLSDISLLIILLARAAHGQSTRGAASGSVDFGGALLSQPGLNTSGVGTIAGQFRYLTPESELSGNGIAACSGDDRCTGQGILYGSRYAPADERLRWELGGSGSAFGVSNAGPAYGWQVLAREHLMYSLGGLFAGVSAGSVGSGGSWHRVVSGHVGGFVHFDARRDRELSGAIVYTDAGIPADSSRPLRYSDAVAYWKHRNGMLELLVGGGLRVTGMRTSTTRGWGAASAAISVSSRAALVFAAGRALEDVTRAVPAVRYVSFSVRLGSPDRPVIASAAAPRQPLDEDGGSLEVHFASDSSRIVSVRVPSAASVELMADFTDWEAVALTAEPNGVWTLHRVIAPGPHRVAIRVNGGAWVAPPNLPRVPDDFGSEVGLLVIP